MIQYVSLTFLLLLFKYCICMSNTYNDVIPQPTATPQLVATYSGLITTISSVTLTWSSIELRQGDYIGVYSPPFNPGGPVNSYIMWFWAADGSKGGGGGEQTSEGEYTLQLVNTRTNYNFVYVRAGGSVLTISKEVIVDSLYPTQGHLAYTGPNQVSVSWTSGVKDDPVLMYSKGERGTAITISAKTDTYTLDDFRTCWIKKSPDISYFRDPGFLHTAVMTDLVPDTVYTYTYGTKNGKYSEPTSFKSPPPLNKDTKTSVIFYGDMGTSLWKGQSNFQGVACVIKYLANQIDKNLGSYDLLLHVGDLSYATFWGWIWDMWIQEIVPIAGRVPYMISLGNHEFDYPGQKFTAPWTNYGIDSNGECGIPTYKRFNMPWAAESDVWWYSFNYGNLHIAIVSLEHNFTENSPQWIWLKNDLSRVDRNTTPWVILCTHRPFYSSGQTEGDHKMEEHIRSEMEELIYNYGVDLVLGGHYHNYERTCPLYKEKCIKKGPIHVVAGTAGTEIGDKWDYPVPKWSIFRMSTYGHVQFIAHNSTSLEFTFIGCSDGSIHDTFWIHK
eukprot:TRINITY_DN5046_c1_g2_i3.p1 TRINITY_DN5046_c1_g2~~TRINITY_DN5046_c1_g2_i3.p1  ORF type:complete len:556 (-),score=91.44 TRINITY_DN5046_c1_g2_i3:58-1725(-)